ADEARGAKLGIYREPLQDRRTSAHRRYPLRAGTNSRPDTSSAAACRDEMPASDMRAAISPATIGGAKEVPLHCASPVKVAVSPALAAATQVHPAYSGVSEWRQDVLCG